MERDHLRTALFILPACFVIAFAGLFLWKDYKKSHTTAVATKDNVSIGRLTRSIKNVKLKREENAYWDETASGETQLFNRDSIRTGPDSIAFIKMGDGSQLVVEENSLIVLETNNERLVVNLSLGDLNLKGESDNLDIKVNNDTIRSQKSNLQLGVDEKKKTRIFVKSGEATLLDKDKKLVKLETRKVLETNETGNRVLNEEFVRLKSPLDQTQIITFDGKDKIEFIWEVLDSEIQDQTVQVATDALFQKPIFETKSQKRKTFELKDGKYFWRVGWKYGGGPQVWTKARGFSLGAMSGVRISSPRELSKFELSHDSNTVDLTWETELKDVQFVPEIALSEDFLSLIRTFPPIKEQNVRLESLRAGRHYARIRVFNADNKEIARSDVRRFEVQIRRPQIPILAQPAHAKQWIKPDPVRFQWKKDALATQYRLTVAKNTDLTDVVWNQVTADDFALWRWKDQGVYYWGVEALGLDQKVVGESLRFKLSVDPLLPAKGAPLPITLIEPAQKAEIKRVRKTLPEPVPFEWLVSEDFTNPFELLISQSLDFKDPIQKTNIDGHRTQITLDRSGNYFWKVKTKRGAEEEIESDVHTFQYTLESRLDAPSPILPENSSRITISKNVPLKFEWSPIEGAKKYRLLVEKFDSVLNQNVTVLDQVTTETWYQTTQLPPEIYQWSVRSIDTARNEGAKSVPARFVLEPKRDLSPPKLRPAVVK